MRAVLAAQNSFLGKKMCKKEKLKNSEKGGSALVMLEKFGKNEKSAAPGGASQDYCVMQKRITQYSSATSRGLGRFVAAF